MERIKQMPADSDLESLKEELRNTEFKPEDLEEIHGYIESEQNRIEEMKEVERAYRRDFAELKKIADQYPENEKIQATGREMEAAINNLANTIRELEELNDAMRAKFQSVSKN